MNNSTAFTEKLNTIEVFTFKEKLQKELGLAGELCAWITPTQFLTIIQDPTNPIKQIFQIETSQPEKIQALERVLAQYDIRQKPVNDLSVSSELVQEADVNPSKPYDGTVAFWSSKEKSHIEISQLQFDEAADVIIQAKLLPDKSLKILFFLVPDLIANQLVPFLMAEPNLAATIRAIVKSTLLAQMNGEDKREYWQRLLVNNTGLHQYLDTALRAWKVTTENQDLVDFYDKPQMISNSSSRQQKMRIALLGSMAKRGYGVATKIVGGYRDPKNYNRLVKQVEKSWIDKQFDLVATGKIDNAPIELMIENSLDEWLTNLSYQELLRLLNIMRTPKEVEQVVDSKEYATVTSKRSIFCPEMKLNDRQNQIYNNVLNAYEGLRSGTSTSKDDDLLEIHNAYQTFVATLSLEQSNLLRTYLTEQKNKGTHQLRQWSLFGMPHPTFKKRYEDLSLRMKVLEPFESIAGI